MNRLAAILLAISATMAQADLSPVLAETFDICAGAGQPFDARVAALAPQGWAPIDLSKDENAARQLAAYDLVFVMAYGLVRDDWDPVDARERLDRRAERAVQDQSLDVPGQTFLVQPDGALIRLVAGAVPGEALCVIAAPGLTADLVAIHFGEVLDSNPRPSMMLNHWRSDEPGAIRSIDTLSFTQGAFAGHDAWPMVVIISPEVPRQ